MTPRRERDSSGCSGYCSDSAAVQSLRTHSAQALRSDSHNSVKHDDSNTSGLNSPPSMRANLFAARFGSPDDQAAVAAAPFTPATSANADDARPTASMKLSMDGVNAAQRRAPPSSPRVAGVSVRDGSMSPQRVRQFSADARRAEPQSYWDR